MNRPSYRSLATAVVGTLLVALPLAACGDSDTPASAGSAEVTNPIATDATVATDAPTPTACAPKDGSAEPQQQFDAGPEMCLEDGVAYRAVIVTNHGTLHVDLRADIAPNTVNSFVNLARYHYFDATTCHRAIKNFVVQCGDPTATGRGGPGYEFDDELDKIEPYQIGSVAMANAGPNTNGSQFFIITGDDGAALPPNYTLFGQVVSDDMAIVQALDALANPADGPPLEPIDIQSITIEEV